MTVTVSTFLKFMKVLLEDSYATLVLCSPVLGVGVMANRNPASEDPSLEGACLGQFMGGLT